MGSLTELNELWHNTYTIDYFQTTLPFKGMRFKGLGMGYLVERARSSGLDISEPFGSGRDVKDWYESKEYDKIIKHLEDDLKVIRVIDLNYKRVYGL